MSKISRLSDLNIEDDVLRADFYQRVLQYINSPNAEVTVRVIRPDEEWRQDLVSSRLYATVELRWLVALICDVEDDADPLPVAESFKFPPSSWIRREMRRFIDEVS